MSAAHEHSVSRILEAFNASVIPNSWRGVYVEYVVQSALGEGWAVTDEWAAWDLEHLDGTKIEVKQSALVQTWERSTAAGKQRTSFSIKAAKGEYRGADWFEGERRRADIYIFAFHPVSDRKVADQRNESQWEFHVVPTDRLPSGQKTISLSVLKTICGPIRYSELGETIESLRRSAARLI